MMTMSPQEVMELYGKSVYQIELEMAMRAFATGGTVEDAFEQAEEFTDYLLSRNPRTSV